MAKKKAAKKASNKINVSKTIREYAAANPDAKPKEIAEALSKQTGQTISNMRVSTTLSQAKIKSGKKSKGKKGSIAGLTAALIEAASFVKTAGGIENAQEVLKALAKLRDAD